VRHYLKQGRRVKAFALTRPQRDTGSLTGARG